MSSYAPSTFNTPVTASASNARRPPAIAVASGSGMMSVDPNICTWAILATTSHRNRRRSVPKDEVKVRRSGSSASWNRPPHILWGASLPDIRCCDSLEDVPDPITGPRQPPCPGHWRWAMASADGMPEALAHPLRVDLSEDTPGKPPQSNESLRILLVIHGVFTEGRQVLLVKRVG